MFKVYRIHWRGLDKSQLLEKIRQSLEYPQKGRRADQCPGISMQTENVCEELLLETSCMSSGSAFVIRGRPQRNRLECVSEKTLSGVQQHGCLGPEVLLSGAWGSSGGSAVSRFTQSSGFSPFKR